MAVNCWGIDSEQIHADEKNGQTAMVLGCLLPRRVVRKSGRTITYESMGIEVLGEEDDLFLRVRLPEGWTRCTTDHSMWSVVLDEQGRTRISVFYKAAFYDRRASAHIEEVI